MSIPFELLTCVRFWGQHQRQSLALASGERRLTYGQLCLTLSRINSQIQLNDRSRRVAVYASSKCDIALGVLGALWGGHRAVVLNPGQPADCVAQCFTDTSVARVILAPDDADKWQRAAELHPELRQLAIVSSWNGHATENSELSWPIGRRGDEEWGVLYTSGSTGRPKGIERDVESMQTEFLGWCLELGLRTSTRFYVGRPLFYTGGLVLALSTFLSGGTAVLNEVPADDADALIEDIVCASAEGPLDWVFLVPEQIRQIVLDGSAERLRGAVRGVLVMGAPISGAEKQDLAEQLGGTVRESWGNSESLGTITDDAMLRECPDSVGRPFIGDIMCVVDGNDQECPDNVWGRLAGREAGGFTRYVNADAETEEVKRKGLIISEDIGWRDERDRYFVAGRMQERVSTDGSDYFLPNLENELRRRHEMRGLFCVVHRETSSGAELGIVYESQHIDRGVAENAAATLRPRFKVAEVCGVVSLPRTASGKPDRTAAGAILWPGE